MALADGFLLMDLNQLNAKSSSNVLLPFLLIRQVVRHMDRSASLMVRNVLNKLYAPVTQAKLLVWMEEQMGHAFIVRIRADYENAQMQLLQLPLVSQLTTAAMPSQPKLSAQLMEPDALLILLAVLIMR